MFKFAVTLTLSLTVFAAVASSDQLASASATKSIVQVIVQNEAIAPGLCRLHFEDASTKDVACK
ncbi:hypothetical protein [Thiothrix subterranea]|uniref:Uncharacterized protein n=1 Tax=Thiothrix subterranea TaxID=2735563 RepID=A0AA51R501_9GAMM|nr:hypothetical protein [Thiothrix subterranea]MDQ5769788.1 hypothetical protein [Thiothrix subterranea]WML87186.1 hypothetical protein RCG00_02235 [Thiothrix subterranea]